MPPNHPLKPACEFSGQGPSSSLAFRCNSVFQARVQPFLLQTWRQPFLREPWFLLETTVLVFLGTELVLGTRTFQWIELGSEAFCFSVVFSLFFLKKIYHEFTDIYNSNLA